MTLAFFTSHYPYGKGEPFVQDELFELSHHFEKIVIFCGENPKKLGEMRPVPSNASVVLTRSFGKNGALILSALKTPFCLRELCFGIFSLKKSPAEVAKSLFISNFFEILLTRAVRAQHLPKNTLYYSYWLGSQAAFLAKKIGKSCVARAHGGDCFIERGYRPYRRQVLKGLSQIHSISGAGKEDIKRRLLPFVSGKTAELFVSPLGIVKPCEGFSVKSGGGTVQIVSASNIIELKRLDLIAQALCLVERPVHWTHFGDGPLADRARAWAADAMAKKSDLSVDFRGFVPKDEILHFYAASPVDIFINASNYEGVPVSIMEAFAYKIPAIARNVGGMADIINSQNGILLDKNATAIDFAGAIEAVLASPEMREAAFNTFAEKFSAEKNYALFAKEIKKAVE